MASPYTRLEKYLIQALRNVAACEPPNLAEPVEVDECIERMRRIAQDAVKKAIYG